MKKSWVMIAAIIGSAYLFIEYVWPKISVDLLRSQAAGAAQQAAISIGVTTPSPVATLQAPTPSPYQGSAAVLVPGFDPMLTIESPVSTDLVQ